MRIFDCFTYYNEADILRVRFEELAETVDKFIVVEASETFTGKPKPFYFDSLPSWIDKWENKIVRVKIDFPSHIQSSWDREFYQRNSIVQGLYQAGAEKEDLVLISDADEIIKAQTIKSIDNSILPARLDVKQYFWNYHWQVPKHCDQGARPVACQMLDLMHMTPQYLRSLNLPLIEDGGWHFSFFGEYEKTINKIESFAHTEYDQDQYKSYEKVLFRIEKGIDPFDRFPLKYYEIDQSYPEWVFKNKD